MVVYDSQYRKQYQDPHWDQFAVSEYARKLDYRIGRRSVEHVHQPWTWDSEEEESDVENSKRQVERCQTAKRNTHSQRKETLTEKDSVIKEEDVKKTTKRHKQKKHHEKQHEKQRDQKQHEVDEAIEKKEPRPRQERPQRRRPRRHISGSSKPKPETAVKKEPFVIYGWANEGPIDKKYTYNVRANPSEVYPASMRALKRRELEIKQREYENQQKAVVERELEREKLFKDRQLNSAFLTEYQRSYCLQNDVKLGYDLD